MKREWTPGDVALVRNEWNVWNVAICTLREGRRGWWWRYGVADSWSPIANPDVRPLVVIDPEDSDEVIRLRKVLTDCGAFTGLNKGNVTKIQAALREFANPTPPKPEVYEHIAATLDQGVTTALCGKVWRAGEDVKVVGKCPECSEMVETGWIA